MSNYKERDGTGVLFINEKKNPKAPDYKGHIIAGRDYTKGSKIPYSGWIKKTPRNHLIAMAEDNYHLKDKDHQWPKPVNEDEEVPF